MEALRDYQEDLLRKVEAHLDANDKARVMMQLPTGGGKTVIAGHLLQRRLGNGRKAVWLTHRRELAEQTRGMLTDAGVDAMTVHWTPGTDAPAMSGGAVILMAQTVSRRTAKMLVWNEYDSNDLMVIDEAHHAAADGWERAMRQWPGPVVGMTATPWRLSEREGFDHLFDDLICGPQIADLQSNGWLCGDRVFMPHPDRRIDGGEVGSTGDYTESGIEHANSGRNIMTAGAFEFWQERARDRQTIVYAVSKRHAHNIVQVFQNAGFSADVILGDTDSEERRKTIAKFKNGDIQVLVNVAVATEGFDLPDASCVLITRPTLSLALFMQMVGRGLRPKDDGGDCLILDLAGNTTRHGLSNAPRRWSLEPRGKPPAGEAPVVWCPECGGVSHAASHYCQHCDAPFGKDCLRCGKWRSEKDWWFENDCGEDHDLVCDWCHNDAHIQHNLPPLWGLEPYDDELMPGIANDKIDLDIAKQMRGVMRDFLDRELQEAEESSTSESNDGAPEVDKDAVFHDARRKILRLIDDACAQDRPNPDIPTKPCDDIRCRACSLPRDDEQTPGADNSAVDADPTERLRCLFREFLDRELHRAAQVEAGKRWTLSGKIRSRESMLSDEEASPYSLSLDTDDGRREYAVRGTYTSVREFLKYANSKIGREHAKRLEMDIEQAYEEWKQSKRDELERWKGDLEVLESQGIDQTRVFQQAGPKIVRFFKIVVKGAKLLPDDIPPVIPATVDGNWRLLSPRIECANVLPPGPKPERLRTPDGKDVAIDPCTIADSWKSLLIEVAEWLVKNRRIPSEAIPIQSGRKKLLHDASKQECGKQVKDARRLSNGLCLHPNTNPDAIRNSVDLLNEKSRLGGHFYVQYRAGEIRMSMDGEPVSCYHTHPELCRYRWWCEPERA